MIIRDEPYQPYFRAFILHHGYKVGDNVLGHDYLIWNMRKWNEWRKLNGIPSHFPASKEHHAAFEKWLFDTAPTREGVSV